jgi:N-acetyl-beta-hexosaminidase
MDKNCLLTRFLDLCDTLRVREASEMTIGIDEVMSKLVQGHYPTSEILEALALALEDQAVRVKAHDNAELALALSNEAVSVRSLIPAVE